MSTPTPSRPNAPQPILPGVPVASELLVALDKFFALPNWENRGPEWKDIDGALNDLFNAYSKAKSPATADPATFPKAEDSMGVPIGERPLATRGFFYHAELKQWDHGDGTMNTEDYQASGYTRWKSEQPSAGTEQKERGDFLREVPGYPCWGWTFMGGGQWHRLTEHPNPARDICSHYLPDQPEKPTVTPKRGSWSAAPTDVTTTPLNPYDELRDTKQALWVAEAKLGEANRLLDADAKIRARIVGERDDLTARLALTAKRLGEAQETMAAFYTDMNDALREDRVSANPVVYDIKKVCADRDDLRVQLATSQARLVEVEKEVEQLKGEAERQDAEMERRQEHVVRAESSLMELENLRRASKSWESLTAAVQAKRVEAESALAQAKQEVENGKYLSERVCSYVDLAANSESLGETTRNHPLFVLGMLIGTLSTLRAANTALSAQVEELKRDGERLDWLDRKMSEEETQRLFGSIPTTGYLRSAIDAARAHAKQSGQP